MRVRPKNKPNAWIDEPVDLSQEMPTEGRGNLMGLEEIEAIVAVMKECVYTWGRFVDQFENDFAKLVGVKYAYAVTSCTGGMEIASKLIGLTTGEMVTGGPFLAAGWDFVGEAENGAEDIWWIDEGRDYPRLWWELLDVEVAE